MMQQEELKSLAVGDKIALKKPHPCGSHDWQILRVGMDFRLQCLGCGRQVMLPRTELEKRIVKKI